MMNKAVLTEFEIARKTQSELLINYLEGVIADEMIITQFIKPIQVHHIFENVVNLSVPSLQVGNFLTLYYDEHIRRGIFEIFQVEYGYKFVDAADLELMNVETADNEIKVSSKGLNSKFQWSNYVESTFNADVIRAANVVMKKPGEFSPLYIWSRSGMGKTHLLHAVGNEVTKLGYSAYLIEPGAFVKTIVSLRHEANKLSEYIDDFKKYDFLMFDDIQNIGEKEVSLSILFRIVNAHLEANKQIIICSDKNPDQLSGFEDRFVSRFKNGLTLEIKNLEVDDVVKLLEKKLEEKNLSPAKWEREAILFIARNNTRDVRSIEAAAKTVSFHVGDASNIKYTYETVKSFFKNLKLDMAELTYQRIIDTVATAQKISKKDILGKSRTQNIVDARHICMYLIKVLLNLTTVEIGTIFKRDHSSIVHALKNISLKMEINESARIAVEQLKNKVTKIN